MHHRHGGTEPIRVAQQPSLGGEILLSTQRPSTASAWIFPVILAIVLAVEIYPIFWLLTSSVKSSQEFLTHPSYSLPQGFHWENYVAAWTTGKMGTFFLNSLFVTLGSLVLIVFLSVTVSFALTKMQWKLKTLVLNLFLAGIMVPVTIVLIPLFTIYKSMSLLNTHWSLILTYTGFGLSLSVYLLTAYFQSVPDELLEASVIDGCTIYQTLGRIVLPLAANAIVTVIVIQFFFRWNDMLFSMTFISKTALKTVQTGLMFFSDEWGNTDWGAVFAAISIAVMPTLLLYVGMNKLVMTGMTAGAVKG
jgi:raffinose/stachyose/melibiose transport system permease protein